MNRLADRINDLFLNATDSECAHLTACLGEYLGVNPHNVYAALTNLRNLCYVEAEDDLA